MKKKKHPLLHSQISGIVWLIVVLLVVLAIKLFSQKGVEPPLQEADSIVQKEAVLEKIEDSAYRSRRQKSPPQEHRYEQRRNAPVTTPLYTSQPPAPTRQPLVVELNTADTTTLTLLHGIGPAFARRIVAYRERLGGYTAESQLLEVYGFTPALLDHIAPYLRVDTTAVRRINVNGASLKELIRHPYVEYYFARDLVNLRARGVTFEGPDDLRSVPSASDTLLSRLLPYLDF